MTSGDFRFIQSFMLRKTGMTIWSEKRYLVEKRLTDQEWQQMIVKGQLPPRPEWVSGFVAPTRKKP